MTTRDKLLKIEQLSREIEAELPYNQIWIASGYLPLRTFFGDRLETIRREVLSAIQHLPAEYQ